MKNQKLLKAKQIQALRLISQGEKKKIIAQQLGISTMTLFRWEQNPTFQTQLAAINASGLEAIARMTNAAALTAVETVQELLCNMSEPAAVRTKVALGMIRAFPAINGALEKGLKHRVADFDLSKRFERGDTFDSQGRLINMECTYPQHRNPDGSVEV